ncbi:RNA-binding protein MEX3B [Drosophila montana]|uniref:RNA-binding protein MEX3B n=1 Tax=Drosophila montana TaxID=40370 RepID=UPI00313D93D5
MFEAQQIVSETNRYSEVSSSSTIALSSLPISPFSINNINSSSVSSSNASGECGIVIVDNSSAPEIVSKVNTNQLQEQSESTSFIANRCSLRMSSHAAVNATTPKMLNDINMTDSIHKINQTSSHTQIIEQQHKVVHPIPLSEDPRTLQLALELSLVGLNENNQNSYAAIQPIPAQNDYDIGSINVVSAAFARSEVPMCHNLPLPPTNGSGLLMPSAGLEDRSKKSQNMTECVPVPSSEHVAEIVGRQGCKIKALRAKTNTYIKTPVRGEEPVFVVTGRKEDVNKAKREILSAADHFSLIRASRKPSIEGSNSGISGNGNSGCNSLSVGIIARAQSGPPCLPGQITIQVRVPYRVVGLVVGPKGATIKHIQQETQTYIVTPSREKEPIFEVTGLPENVETARKQIEAHIALRTGNSTQGSENGTAESLESNEFATLHTINTLTQILNDDLNTNILSSIYKSDISPNVNYADNAALNVIDTINISNSTTTNAMMNAAVSVHNLTKCFPNSDLVDIAPIVSTTDKNFALAEITGQPLKTNTFRNTNSNTNASANTNANTNAIANANVNGSNKTLSFCPPTSVSSSGSAQCHSISANILTRSCSSASSTASTKSTNNSANSTNSVNTPPELLNIWKNLNDSIDVDEGIGDSPSIWNLPSSATTVTTASHCSPTASVSPTDSLLAEHCLNISQKVGSNTFKEPCPNSSLLLQHQRNTVQSSSDKLHSTHRECFVCNEREVTTALVPCGHNMFCMDCANQICVSMESICPICHSIVYHAMRILA